MIAGEKFEDPNQVKITGCDVPPCKLKRRTKASVEQKFVPKQDVESLVNSVNAAVLGVPLPFVGVDGTSACDNIYNLDGTPAGCSLKKDIEYIYKREFPVLQIYPTVKKKKIKKLFFSCLLLKYEMYDIYIPFFTKLYSYTSNR